MSYYSKPFSADVGSIQIFCRIRLTENLSKPLYTETVIQMQCKTKSKMDFFGHLVMICMHIKLTNAQAVNNSLRIRYDFFFLVVLEKRWRYSVLEYLWPNILFSYYVKNILLFFIFFTMYLLIFCIIFFFSSFGQ